MDPIEELLRAYTDLNSPEITELDEEPSVLEFMRFVHLNRPFVVRRATSTSSWKATKLWNATYLREIMQSQNIKIAITPKGFVNAISIKNYTHIHGQIGTLILPFPVVMTGNCSS